jgi:hypothetical protein
MSYEAQEPAWNDLSQVRARWQAVEAEERRMLFQATVQNSLRQWLALQQAFEHQLRETEEILAYLEELQRRLACLSE